MNKFSDAFVRGAGASGRYKLSEDGRKQVSFFEHRERGLSLVLACSFAGSKTWRALVYEDGGKPRSIRIGKYPTVSLQQARKLADEVKLDPDKFLAKQPEDTNSFRAVAENWMKRHVEARALRSKRNLRRILDLYLLPAFGERQFTDIRRKDVIGLLEQIEDQRTAAVADSVLGVFRQVSQFYEMLDEEYRSPIVSGMQRVSVKERARSRILTDEELRSFWSACEESGSFGRLLQLCLLTAQRSRKVSNMRWDDLKDGIWTIKTAPREKGTAGHLKLPKLALNVIAKQPRHNEFVFPTVKGRAKPFSDFNGSKQRLDAKLPHDMPEWVIHDLRRTARSMMSRVGVQPHVAERVLGHVQAGVVGVYDRHPYFDEKATALQKVCNLLQQILDPTSNVIAIRS